MRYLLQRTCTLVLLLASAPMAHAQYTEAQEGSRVRISAPGVVAGRYVGTVLSRPTGMIRVAAPNSAPTDIPIDRITSLEISRGKSRAAGAGRGAVIGGVIGLALGLVSAASDVETRTYYNYDTGRRDTLSRVGLVSYVTFSGAVTGALIGLLVPKEQWERFDLAPRTGIDPRRRRMEVGISVGY